MHNSNAAQAPQAAAHDRWIADIVKNSRATLRVQLSTYMGFDLVTVRVWYRVGNSDELRPSKEGFSLRAARLPELHEAVGKAIAAARLEGIL